ncbi:MAG: hypothetical protein J0M08_12075 [Bacteroidetes bacterium]|nr:hypothetical protein [Bacteroidota bacterium]
MLKKTTLFALFLVSYIPLFLILAIQNLNDKMLDEQGIALSIMPILKNNLFSLVLVTISILSFLYYLIFIKVNASAGFRNPKKVVRIKNSGIEYLSYLATYIIPFIGLKFDTWNNLLATTLLFLIIGFIYTKTNLLYANPTLALFGYYIFQATFEDGEERTVISKGKLKKNASYRYKELDEDLYFIKIT